MNRVQLTVMLDLGTMSDVEVEALRREIDLGGYDWCSLHGVSMDGEEPSPLCVGGFNPTALKVWQS